MLNDVNLNLKRGGKRSRIIAEEIDKVRDGIIIIKAEG